MYYLVILGSILFLFSKASIVTGKVADDEAVPKAVAKAFAMLLINPNGRFLVIMPNINGRISNPWIDNPKITVAKYQPRLSNVLAGFSISITDPATRNKTPTGAKLITQPVTFIMTETRLLKNFKMASPSSPTAAMATPKTKLKTTRPEIQRRKIFTDTYYFSGLDPTPTVYILLMIINNEFLLHIVVIECVTSRHPLIQKGNTVKLGDKELFCRPKIVH